MVRKKISDANQAEVLVQSRRRCCVCFGLNRDATVKKGQIAHLDQNRDNNTLRNLAFLCLEHHDEYDSRTSQSKGLLRSEVECYRDELHSQYGSWAGSPGTDGLLNFLAFQVDTDDMARAAVNAGNSVVWYGESLAFEVLISDAVDYCDMDLYIPYINTLDHFVSWGWLTYATEEREMPSDGDPRIFIEVQRKPVCDKVAKQILEAKRARGEDVDQLLRTAEFREWSAPEVEQ